MLENNNFREFYLKKFLETHLCEHIPGDEIEVQIEEGSRYYPKDEIEFQKGGLLKRHIIIGDVYYSSSGLLCYNGLFLKNGNKTFIDGVQSFFDVSTLIIDRGYI